MLNVLSVRCKTFCSQDAKRFVRKMQNVLYWRSSFILAEKLMPKVIQVSPASTKRMPTNFFCCCWTASMNKSRHGSLMKDEQRWSDPWLEIMKAITKKKPADENSSDPEMKKIKEGSNINLYVIRIQFLVTDLSQPGLNYVCSNILDSSQIPETWSNIFRPNRE